MIKYNEEENKEFYIFKETIVDYLKIKNDNVFKVWIPNCGSGEDAVYVFLALNEALKSINKDLKVLIFATDKSEENISIARKQIFEDTLFDFLDGTLVKSYFIKSKNFHFLKYEIKNKILFSKHDLNHEAPISKIDLIYSKSLFKESNTKRKKNSLMLLFYYALNSNGLVFLKNLKEEEFDKNLFVCTSDKIKVYCKNTDNLCIDTNNIFKTRSLNYFDSSSFNKEISFLKLQLENRDKKIKYLENKIALYEKRVNLNTNRNSAINDLNKSNYELSNKKLELEFILKAFDSVLKNIKTEILVIDLNFNIIKYGNKISNIFSISANHSEFNSSLINSKLKKIDILEKIKDSILNNKNFDFSIELDNRNYWLSINLIEIPNNYLNIDSGVIVSIIDKTDLIKKDKLLFQQSKMASMGEMLNNIAHQWRQPLNQLNMQIIKLQILEEESEFMSPSKDKIFQEINLTVENMSKTIDDFRTFFMPSENAQKYQLSKLSKDIKNMFKDSILPSNVSLLVDYSDDFIIYINKNIIFHIFLVLVNNSIDAIKEKKIKDALLKIDFYKKDKFIISYVDNAGGIKEELLERIFEPYFTTKQKSHGTGIGLYMVKMLVENALKGEIKLSNYKDGIKIDIEF